MSKENSTVYLFDVSAEKAVEGALIEGIQEKHITFYNSEWISYHLDVLKKLNEKGIPRTQWPQSAKWDWESKVAKAKNLLAYKGYCIECDNSVEGFMLTVESKHSCQLDIQKGKAFVYIDFLETAPWNQPSDVNTPKFMGVGTVMIHTAIQSSIESGFKGRIGLHSLPQSEGFYRNCGMDDLGKDKNYGGLVYFEMTEEKAKQYIQENKL